MKTFVFLTGFLLFLNGCSQNNAFTRFNMTHEQELGADSVLKSKVTKGKKVDGLVSVIYLNKVYPNRYTTTETFYVYVYLKTKTHQLKFLLNDKDTLDVQKLTRVNEFTNLTSVSTKWNHYYLVSFPKQADKLNFFFQSGPFSSDLLTFEKDE